MRDDVRSAFFMPFSRLKVVNPFSPDRWLIINSGA